MDNETHTGAKSVTLGGSVAGGAGQVVSDQCLVVAHFARAIATVFDDKAGVAVLGEARTLWPMWTEQSDDLIEQLGNILNGMDAVTDEDAWTFPIVKASVARRSAKATAGETRNAEPIHRRDGDAESGGVNQAPAPSSLAGGEVTMGQRAFERMRDHNDNDAPLAMNSTQRWADLSDREREKWDKVATERPHLYGLGFAALSPEAPERVDARGICEALGFDPTNHHNAAACPYCIPDEALRNEIKARALTPRHEAPDWTAATEAAWAENNSHEAPADHHERNLTASNAELIGQALSHPPLEAPAEGAGELIQRIVGNCGGFVPKGEDLRLCVEALEAAFRARSSAPEAREDGYRRVDLGMVATTIETMHRRIEELTGSRQSQYDGAVSLARDLYLTAAPSADKLRIAVVDIAAERQRQIESENRSESSDDLYVEGELARGAVAYALAGSGFDHAAAREMWPARWHYSWWKPTTPRRDLVKAGALIVAEIERLDRKATR